MQSVGHLIRVNGVAPGPVAGTAGAAAAAVLGFRMLVSGLPSLPFVWWTPAQSLAQRVPAAAALPCRLS